MLDNLERWSLENPDKPAVWMEGASAPMTHLQLHRRSAQVAQALMAYCREHIAHLKCPRSVDFTTTMPRQENGKLYKRLLMERYAQGPAAMAGA